MNNPKNMAASVRARLRNIARAQNRNLDELLTMYMLERLLYRLSMTKYKENFILKGGLLLCVLFDEPHRTTKDIDLLAKHLASQLEDIAAVFKDILALELDDGLVFNIESLKVDRIREGAEYQGVRVIVECRLEQARQTLQIDIGFGDIVVPKPVLMHYPSILDMERPETLVYSVESVVAKKFEAMIKLALLNSRMKDFYDIYILAEKYDFDGRVLYEAIYETFQRRRTPYEADPDVLSTEFSSETNKLKQWKAFCRRTLSSTPDFAEVLDRNRTFLLPIYQAILDDHEFFGTWCKDKKCWI